MKSLTAANSVSGSFDLKRQRNRRKEVEYIGTAHFQLTAFSINF